jgi:hypothetical protein
VTEFILPVINRLFPFQFVFAEVVMTNIPRNVKHPCSKVALSAEEMPVLQDPEEGVLNEVFAQLLAPVHTIKESVQRSLVALKQEPKTAHVAIADRNHQGII